MSLAARAAYRQTALETAPKSRLLVQLYERLEQDMLQAIDAITRRDFEACNQLLIHAQDIVAALAGSLDLTVWSEAGGLAQIYDYLLNELALANLEKSIARIDSGVGLVHELSEAWHSATGSGV